MTDTSHAVRRVADQGTTEMVVLDLAAGQAPPDIAEAYGLDASSVDALARHFGWPASLARLRKASRSVTAGHGEMALVGVPELLLAPPAGEDATDSVTEPDDADAVDVDPPPAGEEGPRPPDAADPAISRVNAELMADTAAVLQVIERTPTGDTATLSMPLGRLVDADGHETILGVVEVDVQLHVPGVLEALAGRLFDGREGGHVVVPTRIERRITPDGEAAIRALAGLLPPGGAAA